MQTLTIVQLNKDDLVEFAADCYAEGYKRAQQEIKAAQVVTAASMHELGEKIGVSVYKIKQLLKYGQVKRTAAGYQTVNK